MHIFKNVGHSLWQHLVGFKDTAAARNDLKNQNSKPNLWLLSDETGRETTYEPAPWVLTAKEVQTINRRIQLIRTPTRYGAFCRNMFTLDDKSLSGLKTHDWHNFVKVRFSQFSWFTSKEIDKGLIPQKKRECIELLCLMEKELPTSFFDIQVHLLIHLVDEIELAGVVSARWMFWAERFMGVLKGYVRQKARPEGSMAEGWMLEECMYYVCEYLEQTDFEAPCVWTNESSSTMSDEVLSGKGVPFQLKIQDNLDISTFIVYNSECMKQYVDEYEEELANQRVSRRKKRRSRRQTNANNIDEDVPSFMDWLYTRMQRADRDHETISREQREFMIRCERKARMYTNMWAYGQHRWIKAIDIMRLTQDSSVVASFKQLSRASSRDTNLVDSEVGYVGTIVGIYEISYRIFKQVILKVDWFRAEYKGNSATMRREPSKFWSVDSSKLMRATREPYILPAHVEQAFFYKNPDSHPWWQVVHVQPRGRQLFDSVDPEEANQDELITSLNLDTSTLETCRISLADHDGIVDDENDNHPYSDTTDTEEEEIVDAEHMEEMNVNTNLTAEEFEEVNKDNEDEVLLTVNLRDDDEDY
ncbi:hypothetical protein L7F22_066901 [Adiantum nelumboides]|nr:hypothetical protein [Adiantum nelumboides]